MKYLCICICICFVLCISSLAAPAMGGDTVDGDKTADEAASSQENSDEAKAKELFDKAVKEFLAENYQQAVQYFRLANDMKPSWKLQFNIGQCEAALKHYGLALEAFERYMAGGGDDISVDRKDAVLLEVKRLREMVGTIRVKGVDGTVIFVDDTKRGELPIQAGIRVTAGVEHTLRAELPKGIIHTETFFLGGNQSIDIEVADALVKKEQDVSQTDELDATNTTSQMPLSLTDSKDTSRRSSLKIAGWTLVGVGSATLIGGVATGGAAFSIYNDLKEECGNDEPCGHRQEDIDQKESLSKASIGLFAAGGVIATTGVILLISKLKKEKTAGSNLSLIPVLAPTGASGTFVWRF